MADPILDSLLTGEQFDIYVRHELGDSQRKLVEFLGGRLVVDPRAPRCAKECRRCDVSTKTAARPVMCTCDHPFRGHAFGGGCTLNGCDCARFVERAANGNGSVKQEISEARAALERMDRGEPQTQAAAPPPAKPSEQYAPRRGVLSPWTRESIIEAIKAWAEEHGDPPTTNDWAKAAAGRPNTGLVASRFGNWGNAIEDAGFERPVRGGKGRHARGDDQTAAASAELAAPDAETRTGTALPAPPAEPDPPAAEIETTAPPPAVPQTNGAIELTSVSLRLGDWEVTRYQDGFHTVERDGLVLLDEISQETLAELTSLLATAAQAFGAVGE